MGKNVVVACDFNSKEKLVNFLDKMEGADPNFYCKVGMELFDSASLEGYNPVEMIKNRGHKVFLDLKLKDIPNTVSKTAAALVFAGADMINVHADGGYKMMKGVVDAVNEECEKKNIEKPILLGVTVLTSMSSDDLKEVGVNSEALEQVVNLAKLTQKAGFDGVVCSPQEIMAVKKACGDDFITVTPGIRFADSKKDDQTRIATPACANIMNSDYIVVGRPITEAVDPVEVYNRCKKDFTCEVVDTNEIENAKNYIEDIKSKMLEPKENTAKLLIGAGAFRINTSNPYLLKSGIASPLYCNCRDLYNYPEKQKQIMNYLASLVREYYPDCEAIYGTAMSAISFGALVAERLGLPFGFVRETAKDHGIGVAIEGIASKEIKVVQVEDLITTGTSSLKPINALKEVGAEVLGVAAIVDNNFINSTELINNNIEYHTITSMSEVAHFAGEAGLISKDDYEKVLAYENDPKNESWMSEEAKEKIAKKRLARK